MKTGIMIQTNQFSFTSHYIGDLQIKSFYCPSNFYDDPRGIGEDYLSLILPSNEHKNAFACVTDGVGGSFLGELASKHCNDIAMNSFLSNKDFRYLKESDFPVATRLQQQLKEKYQALLSNEKKRKKTIQHTAHEQGAMKLVVNMDEDIQKNYEQGSNSLIATICGNKKDMYISCFGNTGFIFETASQIGFCDIFALKVYQLKENQLSVFEMEDTTQWSSHHGLVGASAFQKIHLSDVKRLIMFSDGLSVSQAHHLLNNHKKLTLQKHWKDLAMKCFRESRNPDDISAILFDFAKEEV